jgi:hypothetical protein
MSNDGSPSLAHMVFFTMKERTDVAREKLVEACHEYLTDHPGTEYFSAGERAEEFNREVNDQDYDVALHVVFESKAAHDAYQIAPRHLKFVETQKDSWVKVRVFDSWV